MTTSILAKAQKGIKIGPQLTTIVGIPGVGKSTLAAQWPKPIFLDIENGSSHLNVTRLTPTDLPTYESVVATIDELIENPAMYGTLVVDSITKLEAYIERDICGDKYQSIEDVNGGFGKGYVAVREEMQRFMEKLDKLVILGMEVILVGHVQVKKFTDPYDNQTYDRFVIQGNEKMTQIIVAMSYNVFFCKRVVSTHVDAKTKRTQAFSDGTRIMVTEWRPGADAKNRLNLPSEIEMSYAAYCSAIENAREVTPEQLIEEIKALCARADGETAAKAKEKVTAANGNVQELKFIKSKVLEIVKV